MKAVRGCLQDASNLFRRRVHSKFSHRHLLNSCLKLWRAAWATRPESGVRKRVVSKRVVSADVPPEPKTGTRGTFAKTTLLETALLSPSEPFWCWQKGGFQKGGFGGCSPGTKTGTRVRSPKPPFYETALLSPKARSPRKNQVAEK